MYEKVSHGSGSSRLRNSDASRFRQLTLTVTLQPSNSMTISIVGRSVGGGYLVDNRIHGRTFAVEDSEGIHQVVLRALQEAADGLRIELAAV